MPLKKAEQRVAAREATTSASKRTLDGQPSVAGRFGDRAGPHVGPASVAAIVGVGPGEDGPDPKRRQVARVSHAAMLLEQLHQ